MVKVVFEYMDRYTNGEWNRQRCIVESVEECKEIYGVRIDCDYNYDIVAVKIFDNILNSKLADIFDLSKIDVKECELNAQKSIFREVCGLFNTGYSICEIASKLHLSIGYVRKMIKKGKSLNAITKIDTDTCQKSSGRFVAKDDPIIQMAVDLFDSFDKSSLNKKYTELTTAEIEKIHNTIEGLVTLSRQQREVILDNKKYDREQVIHDIANQIQFEHRIVNGKVVLRLDENGNSPLPKNISLADAVSALSGFSHAHANKNVLDGITAEKVAAWEAAKADAL